MESYEYVVLILFIILGLTAFSASIFNIEWYFQTAETKMLVNWLGRTGARIFYAILGVGLIACGIIGLFYWN